MALGGDLYAQNAKPPGGEIPHRPFGKTTEKVSLLCVGGFHMGVPDEAEGIRLVHEAVDSGATFMDNAWCYHNGGSEERMGKALAGGRRDKAFLMTKHCHRDKKTAMQHLEDSLRRLKTDHLDLWQFHEVVYEKDPDMIFVPGGAIEAADVAKKQGKARYIGFTGHKHPWIHLKMLAYDYPWDAVQMPLNAFDGTFQSFEQIVLPVLVKRKIAVLAMKTRGGGAILRTGTCTAEDLWRYVTALPITTVVSGMESLDMLRKNLALARDLKPMTPDEMAAIRQRTAALASSGKHELYKTSRGYDSGVGRRLHGVTSE
jgi:predicted aldo/keto reductase-like oxidoreductase